MRLHRIDANQWHNFCRPCQAWHILLSVGLAGGQAWNLLACALCDWLTNYPSVLFHGKTSPILSFYKDFWYNSPADNPFSSIKRTKVVQVLHGLRRFSTAEHGWHLGVEGHCPDVVAVGVMIITPREEAFYGCSGRWIVFSCRCCGCFSFESKKIK